MLADFALSMAQNIAYFAEHSSTSSTTSWLQALRAQKMLAQAFRAKTMLAQTIFAKNNADRLVQVLRVRQVFAHTRFAHGACLPISH